MNKKIFNNLSFILGLCLVMANGAFFITNFFGLILTLGFFLTVPGYLLLRSITDELLNSWAKFSLSLGLSILILMTGGLALNSLHVFGLNQPLTKWNIFIMLDVITIILLIINRRLKFTVSRQFPRHSKEQFAMTAFLTLLPLLAIGGAIRLNNGASNILTMTLFALIAILFIVLVWRKKLESLYPYALIMMGLSILLSTSLRGSGITGHDIQNEYYVFQLTSQHSYWDISTFRNTYNACLSITILPTIFSKITTISAPYVYKVVFQVIFALGLIPIYLLISRLQNARTALFGGFIFISFPTFLNDMPFLNRQEIALVFFSLLILTSFLKVKQRAKTALTVMFLIGVILSHYSSSYVTIGLLILSWIFYKQITRKGIHVKELKSLPLLNLSIISISLLVTFLWNTQITTTTTGLKQTITGSVEGLIDHSSAQSNDIAYSILSPSKDNAQELLSKASGNNSDEVQYVPPSNLPITKLGNEVSHIVSATSLNSILRSFSAKILQVLLFVGIVVIWLRSRKNNGNHENAYFLALCISCLMLLVLQTILPQVSVDYGTLRFFQQALVILAIPIVVGLETILWFFRSKRVLIIALFFALLFLDLCGFIPQAIGGYPPQLALNNSGFYYNAYYVHNGEDVAANWLTEHTHKGKAVAMDKYAEIRFLKPINQRQITVPASFTMPADAYFYEDFANKNSKLYATEINSDVFEYSYTPNLNNRNNVYSSNDATIYSPLTKE